MHKNLTRLKCEFDCSALKSHVIWGGIGPKCQVSVEVTLRWIKKTSSEGHRPIE
jgi:hypothetical protein